jgi:hypothetical protein
MNPILVVQRAAVEQLDEAVSPTGTALANYSGLWSRKSQGFTPKGSNRYR